LELRRLNVDQYDRIVAAGLLDDCQVELITGLLVSKMPKGPLHVWAVDATRNRLAGLIPPGWYLRKKDPVRIPPFDEPEPDVAVVKGTREDYRARHPGPDEVALVAEVAETTLDRDQGEKLTAYARGRIPVYWIVNLLDRWVEIYTGPGPTGYATRVDARPGQHIPVVIDGVEVGRIAVDDLLP
jgi:Uma2 family endonuclease